MVIYGFCVTSNAELRGICPYLLLICKNLEYCDMMNLKVDNSHQYLEMNCFHFLWVWCGVSVGVCGEGGGQ